MWLCAVQSAECRVQSGEVGSWRGRERASRVLLQPTPPSHRHDSPLHSTHPFHLSLLHLFTYSTFTLPCLLTSPPLPYSPVPYQPPLPTPSSPFLFTFPFSNTLFSFSISFEFSFAQTILYSKRYTDTPLFVVLHFTY